MRPELARYLNQTVDETDSTNRVARELALEGAPHGSWTCAQRQTAGKGRTGNTWISPEGGIYLSLILRDIPPHLWTWIPIAAAVAVRSVLQKHIPATGPEIQIKWPNDLWIHERKLAGFLGESTSQFLVIGLGVNIQKSFGLENDAMCFFLDWCSPESKLTPDLLRAEITPSVIKHVEILTKSKYSITEEYERFAVFKKGAAVSWNEGKKTGKVIGIGDLGELQVQETGVWGVKSLFSEDISKIRKAR